MATKQRRVADRHRAEWVPAEIARLGTDSDRAVAAELGRTEQAVKRVRQALGIGPHRPRVKWSARWAGRLGKWSDRRIAAAMGVAVSTVSRERARRRIPAAGQAKK